MDQFSLDQPDSVTERTLCALDAVQPAAGFEERLLQRLAQQAEQLDQPTRRFGVSMRSVLAGVGCAVLLLVTLSTLPLWLRRSSVPYRARATTGLPSSTTRAGAGPTQAKNFVVSPATGDRGSKPGALNPPSPTPPIHARSRSDAEPGLGTGNGVNEVATDRDLDKQALEDLHAASSPPPPLPLTAQERMVKLMLRRGEKHDLAQLDPVQSVRLTDAEQRSFQTFFDPDPSPELALELKKGNLH